MADRVLRSRSSSPSAAPALRAAVARAALLTFVVVSGVFVLVAGIVLIDGLRHRGAIYPGVRVAGLELGGMSRDEAAAKLSTLPAAAPQQITLTYGGQSWAVPSSDLGVQYDARQTAADAMAYGHGGNLWSDSQQWLSARLHGHNVPVSFRLDEQAVVNTLVPLAPSISQPARDASFVFDSRGKLTVDPGASGAGIDTAGTVRELRTHLQAMDNAPIAIKTVAVPAVVQAKDLQPVAGQANSLAGQALVLTHGGSSWQVAPSTLRSMLQTNTATNPPSVELSKTMLTGFLGQLADQIHSDGKNADVRWDGSRFVPVKSSAGEALDPAATADAVLNALSHDNHVVDVAVRPLPPAVGDSEAQAAAERAQKLVGQPLALKWDGGSATLSPEAIAGAVRFTPKPNSDPEMAVSLDDAALGKSLSGLQDKVQIAAKDAQFRYIDGKVTVVSPEKQGTALNVDQSVAAIKEALLNGSGSATIAVTKVDPNVTAASASSIVIRQKLSSGQTSYAGSIPNRAYNVELAVQRVNGALIPPGGTFSFTGTIGAVDTANGYKLGYGIESTSNGSATTVPSVGGGICQVATTAFHAVWWAGMPIVERNWHLYWIPNYGVKPSGMTGLDATVDTDAGLDFKFKNVTDNWLALVATADGSWVRFELWGTDPGWKVQVDDPAITNRVKADTTMQYEKSDSVKAGQTVLVEHAEDGFDVSLHRRVTSGDKVIDDVTLKSHYVPSENITMVGTG